MAVALVGEVVLRLVALCWLLHLGVFEGWLLNGHAVTLNKGIGFEKEILLECCLLFILRFLLISQSFELGYVSLAFLLESVGRLLLDVLGLLNLILELEIYLILIFFEGLNFSFMGLFQLIEALSQDLSFSTEATNYTQ